jgi:peptide/nickel transport system ATP-binding protein
MTNSKDLNIESLSVKIKEKFIVENISLTAKSNEITALIGASGSGKTTIINAIGGLTREDFEVSGTIRLGDDIQPIAGALLGRAGYPVVFQGPLNSLNPVLSVKQYINEIANVHRENLLDQYRDDPLRKILKEVGLSIDKAQLFPNQLSGGERQRVLIAGALLANPKVILADEPTASLDIISKNDILKIFLELSRLRNIPVLLATHDIHTITKFTQTIILLKNGKRCQNHHAFVSPSKIYALPESKHRVNRTDKLKVDGVNKSFDGTPVLRNISFTLTEGDTLGLIGCSGCGKTTLARCVAGLLEPDSGSISIRDHGDKWTLKTSPNSSVQMIFQEPYASFDPKISLASSVADAIYFSGQRKKFKDNLQTAVQVLRSADLDAETAHRGPSEASGGECQRAAIVRALICHPSILIADESTASLDFESEKDVLAFLRQSIESHSLTMIMISHNITLVTKFCSKLAIMDVGEIVEFGETQEVIARPKAAITKKLLDAASQ